MYSRRLATAVHLACFQGASRLSQRAGTRGRIGGCVHVSITVRGLRCDFCDVSNGTLTVPPSLFVLSRVGRKFRGAGGGITAVVVQDPRISCLSGRGGAPFRQLR